MKNKSKLTTIKIDGLRENKTTSNYIESAEKQQATIRISESALKRILRHFNNKSIYIYIEGVISGRNTIHKAKCEYDIQKRFFNHI